MRQLSIYCYSCPPEFLSIIPRHKFRDKARHSRLIARDHEIRPRLTTSTYLELLQIVKRINHNSDKMPQAQPELKKVCLLCAYPPACSCTPFLRAAQLLVEWLGARGAKIP